MLSSLRPRPCLLPGVPTEGRAGGVLFDSARVALCDYAQASQMSPEQRPWSATEDAVLVSSLAARTTIENTAEFLSRTVEECVARLRELDEQLSERERSQEPS